VQIDEARIKIKASGPAKMQINWLLLFGVPMPFIRYTLQKP
jgi:hypothetical protein